MFNSFSKQWMGCLNCNFTSSELQDSWLLKKSKKKYLATYIKKSCRQKHCHESTHLSSSHIHKKKSLQANFFFSYGNPIRWFINIFYKNPLLSLFYILLVCPFLLPPWPKRAKARRVCSFLTSSCTLKMKCC